MKLRITQLTTLGVFVAIASAASGQQQSPPAQEPPAQKEPQPQPRPPTLDELLGLDKSSEAAKKPEASKRPDPADPSKRDLERKLSAQEAAEQFEQAVELMGETADRLQVSRDAGLPTQRIQEDIIRKLDQMIQSAQQSQQQSRASRSRQQRQQQQPQQQPNQAQGQDQPGGEPGEMVQPPPRRDGELGAGAQTRGAAWGALPERVRDALRQGDADKYSAWYRKWTEAYYKRLAEDAAR